MKQIKFYCMLICAAALLYSCEKESLSSPEEEIEAQEKISFSKFLNSGINVAEYMESVRASEPATRSLTKSHSGAVNADEAYFNQFCSNLPVEDFEEAGIQKGAGTQFNGPLSNDYSDSFRIKAEDIEPGLLITTDGSQLALYGDGYRGSTTKVIAALTNQVIILQFFGDDVSTVGLDISSFPYPGVPNSQEVTITVLYSSGEIHEEIITASIDGTFWGITGSGPIEQVTIASTNEDAWIGVDNIAFGECYQDTDGDGCLDNDDPNDNSNMETSVKIGDCDSGVENRMTVDCGITMADAIDKLEEGDYKNTGQFVQAVAHLTDEWVSVGLISSTEKDALVACAARGVL